MEIKAAEQKITEISDTLEKLDEIIELVSSFTMDETKQALVASIVTNIEDIKSVLASSGNINTIAGDLAKGNYLGNRKIDIDLSLNKKPTDSVVSYSQADITLANGLKYQIPFLSGDAVLELTSHNDIKNYITASSLWANVEYTECTVEEATSTSNTLIRFRDADGHSSNIERVELSVYGGNANNSKPSYFWANSTSALQTIANRVGDIIALGNNIDQIVVLSQRIDELVLLQENIETIVNSGTYALSASTSATSAASSADQSAQSAMSAEAQAIIATEKAQIVQALANIDWVGFDIVDGELVVTTADGSSATPSLVDGEFIINYN